MIRRFLSIAFAAVLTACASDPPLPPSSSEPPVFDHSILAGQRVGPVSLGMTKDQLFAAMGLPVDTIVSYTDVYVHQYQRHFNSDGSFYDGLEVAVSKSSSRVIYIEVGKYNDGYTTSQGLAVGATESRVRELLGPAEKVVLKTEHSFDMYCYKGLRLKFLEGVAFQIQVNPWDCAKL